MRVLIAGAAGKMGRETIKAVHGAPDMTLVAATSRQHAGTDAGALAGLAPLGLHVREDLAAALAETTPDVMVDFTHPDAVRGNAELAIAAGVRPLIGTTGLTADDLAALESQARARGLGVLVAPNFAIGALLMMQFAAKAAQYFDHAEILELHHNQKADAPSGTALKTAEAMLAVQPRFGATNRPETESLAGARGGETSGLRIHSVRLPGLLAHQEVMLGGLGQVLTIRHDAMSRECYMPGVLLGIRKIMAVEGLVYGLEHVL